MSSTIFTERLNLISLGPTFLRASLEGDRAAAETIAGVSIPAEWYDCRDYIALRLGQIEADPALEVWLVRAIGLKSARAMVGYLGFHDRPGADYLQDLSPGGAEFGYTVFPEFRRQGIAREAVIGLMDWAYRVHDVKRFVVSISPQNEASLKLAAGLGFHRIGSHIDESDGPEDIFELVFPQSAELQAVVRV